MRGSFTTTSFLAPGSFEAPRKTPGLAIPPKKTRLYKTWPGAATGLVFADS